MANELATLENMMFSKSKDMVKKAPSLEEAMFSIQKSGPRAVPASIAASRSILRPPTKLEVALPPLRGLSAIGATMARGEAAIAEPMMKEIRQKYPVFGEEKPEGSPWTASGIKGESFSPREQGAQTQFGDVIKEYGKRRFGVNVPDVVANTGGFLALGAMTGGIGDVIKGGQKAAPLVKQFGQSVARKMEESSAKSALRELGGLEGAKAKAEDLTIKILNPSKADLAPFEEKMMTHPGVREAARTIPEAENYRDILKKIRERSIKAAKGRDAEIMKNNFEMGPSYIDEVEMKLQKQYNTGKLTKSEYEQAIKAVDDERDFFTKQKNFDRMEAQRRKTLLDKRAEKIYKQAQKGVYNPEQTGEYPKTVAALAGELRGRVSGGNEYIERMNEVYGNLLKPRKWAAGQSVLAKKADKTASNLDVPGVISSVLSGQWKNLPNAFGRGAARAALSAEEGLASKTQELARIRKLYERFGPKETFGRGIDEPIDAAFSVFDAPKGIAQSATKLLPAPTAPRTPITTAIPTPEFGGPKQLRAPYYIEQSPILFGEAGVSGNKVSMLKKMGINPFTGEMKYGKPSTTLQKALERARQIKK